MSAKTDWTNALLERQTQATERMADALTSIAASLTVIESVVVPRHEETGEYGRKIQRGPAIRTTSRPVR